MFGTVIGMMDLEVVEDIITVSLALILSVGVENWTEFERALEADGVIDVDGNEVSISVKADENLVVDGLLKDISAGVCTVVLK